MVIVVMDKAKSPEQKTKIQFSGAKNPLYFIKAQDKTLHISPGNRRAIGGYQANNTSFTQTQLLLDPDDILYLATDGYLDQNNVKRKKFGSKKLKTLLEANAHADLASQKKALQEALDDHQKGTEQRDDILMMGIKV